MCIKTANSTTNNHNHLVDNEAEDRSGKQPIERHDDVDVAAMIPHLEGEEKPVLILYSMYVLVSAMKGPTSCSAIAFCALIRDKGPPCPLDETPIDNGSIPQEDSLLL